MSIRLEFALIFTSDFHIGAGHGHGTLIDSALLRDPDGVPVIRGTIIAGLLRESLMNLIGLDMFRERYQRCQASGKPQNGAHIPAYCGQFHPDDEDCPVCAIFGSPRHPHHWRISSARPVELVSPQQPDTWQSGRTAAQVTHRVRVDPRTRRAEEHKLFTREEGSGDLTFRFSIETLSNDSRAREQEVWLFAAARLIRNLGASKRRGKGECTIHLMDGNKRDESKEKELLAACEQLARATSDHAISVTIPSDARMGETQNEKPETDPLVLPVTTGEHTYRVRVLLRTDEPLLIARRAEAGNQFETGETIAGTVLRGVLASRVAQCQQLSQQSSSHSMYDTFVQLFFRDTLRCSSLLPIQLSSDNEYGYGYPCIPAPRDLRTCELHPGYTENSHRKGHGVWSLLSQDERTDNDPCPECQKKEIDARLVSLDGFLPLNKAGLRVDFKPEQTAEMHIRMEPQTGRVQRGNLFGYVALEPGQYFVGEITCTSQQTWETVCKLAELAPLNSPNELYMGKAARRGYGKVTVVFEEADTSPWQGPPLEKRLPATENIILTLLSDAIVVDTWGRSICEFEQEWLKHELKLPTTATLTIDPKKQFSAIRTVDSFNATLGLPRNRDVALVAGSSVRLSISGISLPELQKWLQSAEQRGIGVRRDEGFGAIVFNHPIYTNCTDWKELPLNLGTLVLGKQVSEHKHRQWENFVREWQKKLDDTQWASFEHAPFEAVARLLHTIPHATTVRVRDMLNKLGKPDELLPEDIRQQIEGGRDKSNFFATDGKQGMDALQQTPDKTDGKQGIDALQQTPDKDAKSATTLLAELERVVQKHADTSEQQQHLWRIGLHMLADRIARSVHPKEQLKKGEK